MVRTVIATGRAPHGREETAERPRSHGFDTVQLDLPVADIDLGPGPRDAAAWKRARGTARDQDPPICCTSGHVNLIHPDLDRPQANVEQGIIRHARPLGSRDVISGTGTSSSGSERTPDPRTESEEGFETGRTVLAELTQEAHDRGATFILETSVTSVVGSVGETVRMLAQADHPGLGLPMDPTNHVEGHTVDGMDTVINPVTDTLADKVRIARARDVARPRDASEARADIGDDDALASRMVRGVGAIALDAPGMGVLNCDLHLKRPAATHPDLPIVIERLGEAEVPRSTTLLDDTMRAHGP